MIKRSKFIKATGKLIEVSARTAKRANKALRLLRDRHLKRGLDVSGTVNSPGYVKLKDKKSGIVRSVALPGHKAALLARPDLAKYLKDKRKGTNND